MSSYLLAGIMALGTIIVAALLFGWITVIMDLAGKYHWPKFVEWFVIISPVIVFTYFLMLTTLPL